VSPLFTLHRISVGDTGAFGALVHHTDKGPVVFAATLERTYPTSAEAGISQAYTGLTQYVKVQLGIHKCVKRFFVKGGYDTYEIQQDGHTAILFHKGNIEAHSEGCVLVAESFAMIGSQPGIADGSALAEFLNRAGGRAEFDLEVV